MSDLLACQVEILKNDAWWQANTYILGAIAATAIFFAGRFAHELRIARSALSVAAGRQRQAS